MLSIILAVQMLIKTSCEPLSRPAAAIGSTNVETVKRSAALECFGKASLRLYTFSALEEHSSGCCSFL